MLAGLLPGSRAMRSIKSAINFLLRQLCRGYFATLQVRITTSAGSTTPASEYCLGEKIYAHYECDTLELVPMLKWSRFVSFVDQSRDGNWASRILEPVGLVAIRGSSLHNGRQAALKFCRALAPGAMPSVICVDGPTGPAGVSKTGVLRIGRQLGRSVAPVATMSNRFLVVNSRWSKMHIPLPFSKLVLAMAEPIRPLAHQRTGELEPLRSLLDEELRAAKQRAKDTLRQWVAEGLPR